MFIVTKMKRFENCAAGLFLLEDKILSTLQNFEHLGDRNGPDWLLKEGMLIWAESGIIAWN